MPHFTYTAVRDDGVSVTDEAMAADETALRENLEARGLLVLSLRKKGAGIRGGRASAKDFLLFNQEFMTLVKAGLPILQALEILHRRSRHPGFRSALDGILHELRGGAGLSEAMAMHPAYFPPLYTATVRAGEQSGALVDVLRRFIEYQKRMLAVRRKMTTALIYPSLVVIFLIAVLMLFFFYIIPSFFQMFSDQEASLPLLTKLLMSFTSFLTNNALLIFSLFAVFGVSLYFLLKKPAGKLLKDKVKLGLPVIGTLVTQYVVAQLTRTLATLLRGGIPLVQALETTAHAIGNTVLTEGLEKSRKMVMEGISLAEAFEKTSFVPDMTVRMIEVGETSGELPQMLEDIADFFEESADSKIPVLSTLIEVGIMAFLGLVVAVIVLALYLPIFQMGAQIR